MDYTLEIDIEQPRAKVAELFENPENLAFWQPGFQRSEPVSGEERKAGQKTRLFYRHGKRDVELIETVTVLNLPQEYAAVYEAKGMRIEVSNQFEEIAEEKTRWISKNHGEVSGFLMRLMTLVMPGCFKKQSFAYMENFKAFAEEGADIRIAEG